jgi:hypothetical protein
VKILAIRSLTLALSAVAQFAHAHKVIVATVFLLLAGGVVGLAMLGAFSLLMQTSWPKLFFVAVVAVAAWITFAPSKGV